MEIALVLLILVIAIILFATEFIRMDLVSLLVLVSLAVLKLVTVEEAFSGFSNPAVITVAAMFVISAGIANTGAVSRVGERILGLTGNSEIRMTAAIMLCVAFFSAFINNIGATAVMMPVVISMAQRAHMPASKLLIPLAFGSLLGGVCTMIGTPPNILMNDLLQQYTGDGFAIFDFTPVGVLILLGGIAYMALLGRHLLPRRKSGTLTEAYQVKEYITEAEIEPGSPIAGITIKQAKLDQDFELKVRAIMRGNKKFPFPRTNRKIWEGDILFLEGDPKNILKVREKKGLAVIPERDNPLPSSAQKEDMVVVEASLSPNSDMVGKTLREMRFADTQGLRVLGIWRQGAPVVRRVDHVVLRFGDVLLLQGPEEKVIQLGKNHSFLLLGGVSQTTYKPRRAPLAIAILLGVVALAASGIMPIMLSATLGALVLVLGRCLSVREAYASIDWPIILLIAGMLPLGHAMENSGAARLIAELLIDGVGPLGPWLVLATIIFMTSALTEVMSHAAAAVLIAPIAYNTAVELSVSPKPFFMAVAIAASSCFMTPISHQSNALVMGPGGYHFFDFTKVGAPLNLLVWTLASLTVPVFFPF